MNALLPTVLLRGTAKRPDMRAITMHLDDLYGASVGDLVRRIGDYQATGLYCSFTEDRFAMEGDKILEPTVDFLRELLLEPVTRQGIFSREFVESERKNLIADIDAQRNDKGAYAGTQLLQRMCRADSFSVPRLGTREAAQAIDPTKLYTHYRKVLRESPVEIFYVGSWEGERIAALLRPVFEGMDRMPISLPPQTPFRDGGGVTDREKMDISQSRLTMGFTTGITNRDPEFGAMQVFNTLFGGGMTSKLFRNVREEMSLCYSIGTGYYGSKGIMTMSAGIDAEQETVTREAILQQLQLCREGDISTQELTAAKEGILSGLRGVTDSPAAIEGYFSTAALSGMQLTLPQYRQAVQAVTAADVVAVAGKVALHSEFFLEGVRG
jgi:predicted Zn-dependent peptidase